MNQATPEIIPPHNTDAELALLGSLFMRGGEALPKIREIITPTDFYTLEHGVLYRALLAIADSGKRLDLDVVNVELQENGLLAKISRDGTADGGKEFLVELAERAPLDGVNAEYHANIVHEKAMRRSIISTSACMRRNAADDSIPLHDLAADLQIAADGAAGNGAGAIRPLVSAEKLLEQFPMQPEPVIEGLLRLTEVGNLVSPPKMFKSWFLLFIAVCVAMGRDILGFKTRPGRVLLLDYELAPGTLAKRLQAVLDAMNVSPRDLGDKLVIQSLRGVRLNVLALGQYLAKFAAGEYVLVIIDPMYRIFPPDMDENSNVDFAEIFALLQGYAQRLDAALLIVHHLSKGDQSGKATTDLGAGGGSQSRAADAHLAIRPHEEEGGAVLSGVLRSFPPFAPLAIRWTYPVYTLAPELDPANLKRPPKRKVVAKPKGDAQPEPPKPIYTTKDFAGDFLTDEPVRESVIVSRAMARLKTERQARRMLDLAEAEGLADRWHMPKDRKIYFANKLQPALDEGAEALE